MRILQLPDELLKHIMEYAGLKAVCRMAATCSVFRNMINVELIQQGVCRDQVIPYYIYPNDDQSVRTARWIDSCFNYIVDFAELKGSQFLKDERVRQIKALLNRNPIRQIQYVFDFKTCTWTDLTESDMLLYVPTTPDLDTFLLSRLLPLTRLDLYDGMSCQILLVLKTVLEHGMWTINYRQKTSLRKLLEDDLSICRVDSVVREHFL